MREGRGLCNLERRVWEVGLLLPAGEVTRPGQAYCRLIHQDSELLWPDRYTASKIAENIPAYTSSTLTIHLHNIQRGITESRRHIHWH